MPSPAFDISIREDYHRSEVVIFEKILRHGETLRLYIPQEKADRLPDFLNVEPVGLDRDAEERAEAAGVVADARAEAEKAALEAQTEAQDEEE